MWVLLDSPHDSALPALSVPALYLSSSPLEREEWYPCVLDKFLYRGCNYLLEPFIFSASGYFCSSAAWNLSLHSIRSAFCGPTPSLRIQREGADLYGTMHSDALLWIYLFDNPATSRLLTILLLFSHRNPNENTSADALCVKKCGNCTWEARTLRICQDPIQLWGHKSFS